MRQIWNKIPKSTCLSHLAFYHKYTAWIYEIQKIDTNINQHLNSSLMLEIKTLD